MDNNAFERNMINFVNNKANTADTVRAEHLQREMEKRMEQRKAEKVNTIFEVVCWVVGFVTLVTIFYVLSWLNKVPTELASVIPAVFGFATGTRVCSLVYKIGKEK